jgi:hypothetical protein
VPAATARPTRPPTRAEIEGATIRVLSRGGWANPDVLLVAGPAGSVVVKDFRPRGRLRAATLGRWLCAREVRAYRRLAGIPILPALLGRIDACAFALAYRPGVPLGRSLRGRLPDDFVDRLEAGVRAMHARGVVHLDLRHRSNVLAGEDGRPVMLDLGSALCVDARRRTGRWLVRWLGAIDRRAVRKWRVRIGPDQPAPGSGGALAPGAGPGTTSAGSRGASRPM